MAQLVKNLPAMQDTWVQSLGGKDPMLKEMATLSNILAWEIPWMEEPGSLQSMGLQRVGYNLATKWASLIAQLIKNPSAMKETLVRFLGQEDSLEKRKATHFSILAWRIPWTI